MRDVLPVTSGEELLRDVVDDVVRQLAALLEAEPRCGLRIACDRLAIRTGLTMRFGGRLASPTSAALLSHRSWRAPCRASIPPDGDRRRHRDESDSLQVAHPGWPHDPAKNGFNWPHEPANWQRNR